MDGFEKYRTLNIFKKIKAHFVFSKTSWKFEVLISLPGFPFSDKSDKGPVMVPSNERQNLC